MVEMYCLDIFSTYSEGSEPSGIQLKNKQVHRAPYVNIMIWKCIVFKFMEFNIFLFFIFFGKGKSSLRVIVQTDYCFVAVIGRGHTLLNRVIQ